MVADTPQGLTPHGFSVRPRRQPRESPQALPAPVDSPGRVLVSIEHASAVGADLGAHRPAVLAAFPTPAPVLAGGRRINRFHALAGACCRERAQGQEAAPPGVGTACVPARLPRGSMVQLAAPW